MDEGAEGFSAAEVLAPAALFCATALVLFPLVPLGWAAVVWDRVIPWEDRIAILSAFALAVAGVAVGWRLFLTGRRRWVLGMSLPALVLGSLILTTRLVAL